MRYTVEGNRETRNGCLTGSALSYGLVDLLGYLYSASSICTTGWHNHLLVSVQAVRFWHSIIAEYRSFFIPFFIIQRRGSMRDQITSSIKLPYSTLKPATAFLNCSCSSATPEYLLIQFNTSLCQTSEFSGFSTHYQISAPSHHKHHTLVFQLT